MPDLQPLAGLVGQKASRPIWDGPALAEAVASDARWAREGFLTLERIPPRRVDAALKPLDLAAQWLRGEPGTRCGFRSPSV